MEERKRVNSTPWLGPSLLRSFKRNILQTNDKIETKENDFYDFFRFFFFLNRVSLKNLVYIGLRSIDPYERLIAKKFNIHLYGMRVSMSFYEIVEFHCLSQINLVGNSQNN